MGQQEPHEVQPGEVQSPARTAEQAQAPTQAGATWMESSLAEKDLGDTELTMSKGGQWCPGLHQERHCQMIEGDDRSPLLNTGEAICGVLGSLLGSPV